MDSIRNQLAASSWCGKNMEGMELGKKLHSIQESHTEPQVGTHSKTWSWGLCQRESGWLLHGRPAPLPKVQLPPKLQTGKWRLSKKWKNTDETETTKSSSWQAGMIILRTPEEIKDHEFLLLPIIGGYTIKVLP